MNEHERKEFERHKKIAEEQLNKMYFGANKNQKSSGKLEMPAFLTAPNKPKTQENVGINSSSIPPKQSNNTNPQKKNSNNSRNFLNLLNFKNIKIDNDRLIILAVCLLLSSEDTDELLMLALLYVML